MFVPKDSVRYYFIAQIHAILKCACAPEFAYNCATKRCLGEIIDFELDPIFWVHFEAGIIS